MRAHGRLRNVVAVPATGRAISRVKSLGLRPCVVERWRDVAEKRRRRRRRRFIMMIVAPRRRWVTGAARTRSTRG